MRNVTELTAPAAPTGALRARLGIEREPLVLHQGAPAPDRGGEQLIEAMAELPAAHLVFLGSSPFSGYEDGLRERAVAAGLGDRVHFLPSVPLDRLLEHTADADVGVSLLQDTCENHRLALPNKVFEYVAAGVPVVVSELPELTRPRRGARDRLDDAARRPGGSSPSGCARRWPSAAMPAALERLARAAEALSWAREQRAAARRSTTGSRIAPGARSCSCAIPSSTTPACTARPRRSPVAVSSRSSSASSPPR